MLPHRRNSPLKAARIVNPGVNPGVNPDVNPFLRHSGFPGRGFSPGARGWGCSQSKQSPWEGISPLSAPWHSRGIQTKFITTSSFPSTKSRQDGDKIVLEKPFHSLLSFLASGSTSSPGDSRCQKSGWAKPGRGSPPNEEGIPRASA